MHLWRTYSRSRTTLNVSIFLSQNTVDQIILGNILWNSSSCLAHICVLHCGWLIVTPIFGRYVSIQTTLLYLPWSQDQAYSLWVTNMTSLWHIPVNVMSYVRLSIFSSYAPFVGNKTASIRLHVRKQSYARCLSTDLIVRSKVPDRAQAYLENSIGCSACCESFNVIE